jgi:hypothetical protein
MKTIYSLLSSLFKGIAFVFIMSPVLLYWFMHGDGDRYVWLINGPAPFSQLGGGPFQLWASVGLLVLGVIFIVLSLIISRLRNNLISNR